MTLQKALDIRLFKAKYLKRTGGPGHYKYIYKEKKGRKKRGTLSRQVVQNKINSIYKKKVTSGEDFGEASEILYDELKKVYDKVETEGFDWKEADEADEWKGLMSDRGYVVVEDPIFEGTDSLSYIAVKGLKKGKLQ